jgi:cytochrome P450/deferrochelatase/peroxidase EfeB
MSAASAFALRSQGPGGNTADADLPFPGRGQGFCLVMKLRYPAQMGELLKGVEEFKGAGEIDRRLKALKYVHYSRFVPLVDRGVLLIVTEFDGDQKDYVMDFAAVLDKEFSFILSFMEDAPPLPVGEHPKAFYAYVERNTKLLAGQTADKFRPVGPLGGRSVLDVLGDDVYAAHNPDELLPKEMSSKNVEVTRDWKSDIQGNIVKGFGATHASHYFIRFTDEYSGASLLGELDRLATSGDHGAASHCLNIGLTFAGLKSLGMPHDLVRRFPWSFQRGPSEDERGYVPGTWPTRLTQESNRERPVHAVVSLSMRGHAASAVQQRLEQMLAERAGAWSRFDGQRIDGERSPGEEGMLVHFGLRDGISQPKVKGVAHRRRDPDEADSPPGDFVLGHPNSRGGSYIGELPVEWAQNGSYSAFLVVDQDVQAFHDRAGWAIDPPIALPDADKAILYAEKLLGRRDNGRPMHAKPDVNVGGSLDNFDYWATPTEDADQRGQRCPFGAHIRRMNPRRGVVVGVPAGRRIIRRGMPFGPGFDASRPDDAPRGLVGHFFCGDLEDQYEFLQKVWGTGDVSAPGLAGTRDPFAGARSGNTPFRFQWSADDSPPTTYTLTVPPLVSTRFAAYLFMPGKAGLKWIAARSWEHPSVADGEKGDTRKPARKQAPGRVGAPGQALSIEKLDPLDRRFMQTPHRYYAALRSRSPVIEIGRPYEGYWALSYQAVKDAQACLSIVKPGRDRGDPAPRPESVAAGLKDGLFFQDPQRHTTVRKCLNSAFPADHACEAGSQGAQQAAPASVSRVTSLAQTKADELLGLADSKGVFDIVSEFAAPLTSQVFMDVMGIPLDPQGAERRLVDGWVRAALAGHDKAAPQELRVGGLTASMALRAYFNALGQCPVGGESHPSLMDAIRNNTLGAGGAKLTADEAMNTALHFALGGYLSTQFLITTGVYNLLLHPAQWGQLKEDRSASLMDRAIDEMLRFDSPFMMADRWVPEGAQIAGVTLKPRSRLTLVYGSANRDPDAFDAPETFDIAARRGNGHLAFGGEDSPYNCIGRYMARWIASVAFRSLLDHFPDASIAEIGPWLTDPYYRSLSRLTLFTR